MKTQSERLQSIFSLLLFVTVFAGSGAFASDYGTKIESSRLLTSYPWDGLLISDTKNVATRSSGWKETKEYYSWHDQKCFRVNELRGEDGNDRSIDQPTTEKQVRNKYCAPEILASYLKAEFGACARAGDEERYLDENCECLHEEQSASGFFSILRGKAKGREKLSALPWSACAQLFPDSQRLRARQIAHQVYLDFLK